jgi:hypothetical protein
MDENEIPSPEGVSSEEFSVMITNGLSRLERSVDKILVTETAAKINDLIKDLTNGNALMSLAMTAAAQVKGCATDPQVMPGKSYDIKVSYFLSIIASAMATAVGRIDEMERELAEKGADAVFARAKANGFDDPKILKELKESEAKLALRQAPARSKFN